MDAITVYTESEQNTLSTAPPLDRSESYKSVSSLQEEVDADNDINRFPVVESGETIIVIDKSVDMSCGTENTESSLESGSICPDTCKGKSSITGVAGLKRGSTGFIHPFMAFLLCIMAFPRNFLHSLQRKAFGTVKVNSTKRTNPMILLQSVDPENQLDSSSITTQITTMEEKVSQLSEVLERHSIEREKSEPSAERIKRLESELAQTKKTIVALLSKQDELYQYLEDMKEEKWARKKHCWG
eukprot:c23625_g2_i1 orf=821-1546(+)